MGRIRSRQMLMRSTALAGALSVALFAAGTANAETKPITFDLPAQPLGESLRDFYRASGEQIVFSEDLVAGRTSAPLKGAYTADQALAMLLEGTNLTARRTSTGVVMIEAPQSGSAAGDGADAGTVQALIVTAQKREENIQDVPIAMSAFTQEDLTRSQVAGGPDLMTQVPNFTFTKTNFSGYSIQIRGIGTQAISATTDAAVAVAFNNTPFIRNRFFEQEFYDLQRVEVLRGPQGTLYGRNATAGVVNIISAKPSFGYEARLSGDVSNYSSSRIEGMINVPLVEDKVALRLAGAWTKREGYDTNQITGNPIDGRDLWSTRLSIRFAPTDSIQANLIWEHFQEDDDRLRSGKQLCKTDEITQIGGYPTTHYQGFPGAQNLLFGGIQGTFSQGCAPASLYAPESFQTPNGIALPYYIPLGAVFLPTALDDPYVSRTQSRDLRVIESTVDPKYRAKSDLAEIQINVDVADGLTLSSETAYSADVLFSMEDYNRFNTAPGAWDQTSNERAGVLTPGPNGGIFCDPQLGCSDRLVAVDVSTARSRQFSQEFRLASDKDGPFNFSVGVNFLRYDTEDKYYVFINSISLISALSPYGKNGPHPPYMANVTDNADCLKAGFILPDPTKGAPILNCTYMDPNPIGSLNDLGHNYFLSRNPYKLISYAVFGEAYYNITDSLKLTAGLRWTVDKKEAPLIPSWLLASGTVGYPVAEVVEQEWREPTGRLTLDWKPDLGFTDETLLYASYAHGYKAGGANPPRYGVAIYQGQLADTIIAESATHPKTFEPEFVNAFEIGAKNTLLDGRLTLNSDAFYYDYTGYQISQIVDRSAVNMNFDAKVWGFEVEADWRPLENLRLGFKGGYEKTRVADGEKAVDIMDRSDGDRVGYLADGTPFHWVVVRPFPSIPSNCVMPDYLWAHDGGLFRVSNNTGGSPGPCEQAYLMGFDPITNQPYVANPLGGGPNQNQYSNGGSGVIYTDYPGFNPATAPNNGEGFDKDLSGHELPNAPHFTATITGDYTIPLPNDWLATLHTDLYYQSEAWTRIFNMPGYDKLKAYTNVNFAAIFSNETAGWKVMAYVKNAFDRDSITGAFLNSDDTGLTTNVFLTEPRLYGLRVTKEFTGGPWWTGAGPNHTGPYPFTIELGGQVARNDARYSPPAPSFIDAFPSALQPQGLFNRDLDRGDNRSIQVTWRPSGSPWSVSAAMRYGRTNNDTARFHAEQASDTGCAFGGPYAYLCPIYQYYYGSSPYFGATNWSDAAARSSEQHTLIDFAVGRDVGLGFGGIAQSRVNAGLRYGDFKSTTDSEFRGVPEWYVPDGWLPFGGPAKYPATGEFYTAQIHQNREFKGLGPVVSWDAAKSLWGSDEAGRLNIDWSIGSGVLFGKQKTTVRGTESVAEFVGNTIQFRYASPTDFNPPTVVPIAIEPREKSVTVPLVDLSLGLSYEIQRIKVSTGYRWERYFDALDGGYGESKSYDRTIDGPYFKVSVGFGG